MAIKPIIIKFFAPVIDVTVNALMDAIDQKMKQGIRDFTILISSTGGSVMHGLSTYNYLKGLPANIITHNFGNVDSIGLVLYCAGAKRLSVPQARFLLHGVNAQFTGNTSGKDHRDLTGEDFLVGTYDVATNGFSHELSLKRGCLSRRFFSHFGTLGHGFFNTANHVERLFRQVVVFTINNAFKGADGVFQCHVFTW